MAHNAPMESADAPATVLLVEDDRRLQILGQRVLERRGYRVMVAGDGAEAVRLAVEAGPRVVLMDIEIPGLGGVEATVQLKAQRPEIPVIAVTAHAMSGDRERFMAAGCDGFLSKPYDIAQLLDVVRHFAGEPAAEPRA
jgi:CheY-like chemotaxis protein